MTSLADKPRSPRHIVWDWNGTLLDDNHAVVSAVNEVCAAFEREHIDIDEWRAVFSRPLLQCYERLLRRSLSDEDWARIDVLYHDAYRELLHTCGLAKGVPHALEDWRETGRTQSLLSMWFHEELVALVTQLGLHGLFARMDGLRAEIGGGSKATHLERHLSELRLDPADVVLIGDVVDDAEAARHAGTSCVLVTTGVMSRSKLEGTDFPVVDSIPEALALLN
ncbi:phosphoglycolate phosphatase-like HAD superfamily hydrolase [Saccharopolyspora erythraea NRRL 2338]|uniref:Phosphatase n=2 Tax=Saccharopolyspora erythraea TaxID=1836 RepID=A4FAI1_SACEN|nr:HAD family hydrolase [Saccharopolyspora erythraea]EQD83318.1 phosphatase [Saccharopolyspora erythraea D]PFG94844.1 phosphoglycolate phosphatase-like HAD superfamily hydrolase [Saccharopolyspora erythraea NRRL 2338]QRK91550.1 HAD family hydrolase [Saccharopolyspora erythraea]CAM01056.1 phosphatase [Saccharopolyspora erythraea NRRL 2338]